VWQSHLVRKHNEFAASLQPHLNFKKSGAFLVDEEKKLISKARRGDKNAFKELVIRYQPQVARAIVGILGPGPEAEDVGQEAFIKFYKSMSEFRGESSPGTYITRIAINLSLNVLRKRKISRRMFFRKTNMTNTHPMSQEDPGNSLEAEQLINKGLQKIPQRFRTVLILRYMNEYSVKETAEILSLPQGTVMSRLARGMEKLRKILEPFYERKNKGVEDK
jgi:RNA polymerase sigma-70 factor (ECF subfamily)